MITKHIDPHGNEYLSKMLDDGTFLFMDYRGKQQILKPKAFESIVNNKNLNISDYLEE